MKSLKISIIIVSYNTCEITVDTLFSVKKSITQYPIEIIVVDNCSCDNSVQEIKKAFPEITLIVNEENLGFSKANNIGINRSKGDFVLLLNSDTLLLENTLEDLINEALEKKYSICGPMLLNKDLTLQRSWFNFPSATKVFLRLTNIYLVFYYLSNSLLFKVLFYFRKPAFMQSYPTKDMKVDYLSFACILIKRDLINKIGLLDENLFFYHEDCEYGLRCAKNNHDIFYCVKPKLIHLGGSSSMNFSLNAMKNDVRGLLYNYKKYFTTNNLNKIKFSIRFAMNWRIFFWYFGFYRTIGKIGIYKETKNLKSLLQNEIPVEAYKDIRKILYENE